MLEPLVVSESKTVAVGDAVTVSVPLDYRFRRALVRVTSVGSITSPQLIGFAKLGDVPLWPFVADPATLAAPVLRTSRDLV